MVENFEAKRFKAPLIEVLNSGSDFINRILSKFNPSRVEGVKRPPEPVQEPSYTIVFKCVDAKKGVWADAETGEVLPG